MTSTPSDARPGGIVPPSGLNGHQALAIAVIHQAFSDLMAGGGSAWGDAARFFRPTSPDLRFWAAVAGVDPVLTAERAWFLWRVRAPFSRCA